MHLKGFSRWLSRRTNHELYFLAKRFLTQEYLGFTHNRWKRDLLYEESEKRNKSIYTKALEDSAAAAESIRIMLNESARAVNLQRIDFMSRAELNTFLNTAGASFNHPALEDSAFVENLLKKMEISSDELSLCAVSGDSMQNARIFDGDLLLVDRNAEPYNGCIALLSIAGSMLVKRLKIDRQRLYLVSENEKYPPYQVHESDDFFIYGVVKMLLVPAAKL